MRHVQIGAHSLQVEGDLLFLRAVGTMNEAETIRIFAVAEEVHAIYGYHLGLTDARDFDNITPEARRYAGQWMNRHTTTYNATFGASLLITTVSTLIHRAIRIVTGAPTKMAFFKTEAAAREWLYTQRPHASAQPLEPDRSTKSPLR